MVLHSDYLFWDIATCTEKVCIAEENMVKVV